MKLVQRKIKSFTMFEIAITIFLSLLLFSILYFSYTIILKNVKRSEADLTEVLLFKNRMQILFDENDSIFTDNNLLEFYNVFGKSVLEFQESTLMLYKNENADTLFTGQCNYFIQVDPETQLTTRLMLELKVKEQNDTIVLFFNKNYAPAVTLRRKEVNFEY